MSDSLDLMDCSPPGSSVMGFPRQGYWSGSHLLLQGIFQTQGSNLGLLHCRRIIYRLSHQGSPWLTLLSITSKSIHVAANGIISFFFMTMLYSIVYMHHIFFILSSINEHSGCFHVLAIINNAAINLFIKQK